MPRARGRGPFRAARGRWPSRAALVLAACALAPPAARAALRGMPCNASAAAEAWTFVDGTLRSSASGECATALGEPVAGSGTALALAPCTGGVSQRFAFNATSWLVYAAAPAFCVNLATYNATAGAAVWLFECSTAGCLGNCDWQLSPSPLGGGLVTLRNPDSSLCVDDGSTVLPPTCAAGSPAAALPFCDAALSLDTRVADLLSRLTLEEQMGVFVTPYPPTPFIERLNVKSIAWDSTCIAGLSLNDADPVPNVTVFPAAIAQAASWDVDLVARLATATSVEARIVNAQNYVLSGGTSWQARSCDGGPLANSVHDARYGRVSETSGEDPLLVSQIGASATRALQQRTADRRFLAVSAVTRHWAGFHGANDLPDGGDEYMSAQWLVDQQAPPYRAMQAGAEDGGADAEGLMCGIAAINGVPSCVDTLLMSDMLRGEWHSRAFVQGDCCGSLLNMVDDHHFFTNYTLAVAAGVKAGVHASYDGDSVTVLASLAQALELRLLAPADIGAAAARILETRFRLGEFDTGNAANPFRDAPPAAALDGAAHRALAREAAAAGAVLLRNDAALLPLAHAALAGRRLALLGPWADCAATANGYACAPCYSHSYSGSASSVATLLSALQEDAAAVPPPGLALTFVPGCAQYANESDPALGLAAAVAAARLADVVVVAVGLGCEIETEGLDRTNFSLPPAQAALLDALADAGVPPARVALIIFSGGGVDLGARRALAGAVLQAWYPGEETGHGLADVLFGRVVPAGRMPLTTYTNAYLARVGPVADFNLVSRGMGRTYRMLADPSGGSDPVADGLVASWFGAGLSYTTFAYADLALVRAADGSVDVAVTVANTGALDAAEVTQVYLSVPPLPGGVATPFIGLAAFAKTALRAGAPPTPLHFTLARAQLAATREDGSRVVSPGQYTVYVSGHLPSDATGVSNVLAANFTVPPAADT